MTISLPPQVLAEPRYRQALCEPAPWATNPTTPAPMPIWHLDGVAWWAAAPPPRHHEHWAQTVGVVHDGEVVYRCACGALAFADTHPELVWLDDRSGGRFAPDDEEAASRRLAALVIGWMLLCVALGALGGRAVAATAYSPLPWVQWLGLAALAPAGLVFAGGLIALVRFMRR